MADDPNQTCDEGVRPLAQVTVLDAKHGDCNLVDFSYPNPSSTSPLWYRMLIDTGPRMEGQGLVSAVNRLVKKLRSPAPFGTQPPPDVPKLDQIQITHADDDHIGNAFEILVALWRDKETEPYRDKTLVLRRKLPKLYCKPEVYLTKPDDKPDIFCIHGEIGERDRVWRQDMDDAGIKVNVNLEVKFNSQDFKLIDEGSNSVQLQRIRQEHELGPIKVTAQVELIWKEKNTIVVADLTQGFAAVQTSTVESVENRIVLSDKQKEALQNILELRVPTQEPPAKRPRRKCVAAYKASNSSNTSPSVPVRVPVFYGARKAPPYTWPSNTPMRRTIWQELNLEKNISGLKKQWASLSLATPEYNKNILASNDACVRIVGPKPEETQRLARLLIAGRYKADESAKEKDPTSVVERIPDMGGFVLKDVMNQTSLITEFSILSGRGHFTMLFTGDAYGEDILKNVRSWLCVNMREYCLFDVLKVPHHASTSTSSQDFYRLVRANVYIICGLQHAVGERMPSGLSLVWIIEGFKNKNAAGNRPFLIFLSDPMAETNTPGWVSPWNWIRTNRPSLLDVTIYNYQLWVLRQSTTTTECAFGSLVFGADGHGDLVTKIDQNRWKRLHPPP